MSAEASVLIIGEGGREDTIRRAIEASPEVGQVEMTGDVEEGLERFGGRPDFAVVGPETPLIRGLASWLRHEMNIPTFGVGSAPAQYEASKAMTADLANRHGITAPLTVVSRTLEEDLRILRHNDWQNLVIKADKAAAGKGVVVPETFAEALAVVRGMRSGELFDGAGRNLVVFQHRNRGPESSLMAVVGGKGQRFTLPLAQDHKRLLAGDKGPNTGGMGAYAPVPETVISKQQREWAEEDLDRFLAATAQEGTPYTQGAAFLGFMSPINHPQSRPELLEVNCRLGDPETQVQLPLLTAAGVDVYRLFRSAAEGDLEVPSINVDEIELAAISVCLAAANYPDTPRKGDRVYGLDSLPEGVIAQLAGVKNGVVTGGRAIWMTAIAQTLRKARDLVFDAIDLENEGPDSGKVGFMGAQVREDIAWQALTAT